MKIWMSLSEEVNINNCKAITNKTINFINPDIKSATLLSNGDTLNTTLC
jgi:hypothetical protein